MKIGFASRWSPLDKRSWSGISYYSYQQIKKYLSLQMALAFAGMADDAEEPEQEII
jgi:hypothetical protein